jgi:hypothetical protein
MEGPEYENFFPPQLGRTVFSCLPRVGNKGRRPKKATKLLNSLKHVDLNKELILGGDKTSPPPPLWPPVVQITLL